MKYSRIFLLLAFMLAAPSLWAQSTAALGKVVTDLTNDEALRHATFSVCVYNIDKRTCVYQHNAQTAVTPASVTKLFTTAAGFDKLGSDFRFKTILGYSGTIDKSGTLRGDLYIIGGGDPLLGSYRYRQTVPDSVFAAWHKAVAAAGIRAVDGRVRYDASIFNNQPLHNSWMWGDIGNYYACGVSGLNFHENMYFIHFTPGARQGSPATISRIEPQGIGVRTVNEVLTGAARTGDQVIVYGDPFNTVRTCTGTVPLDVKDMAIRAGMPKPGENCATLFTNYLRNHHVSVSGAASEAIRRPDRLETLLEYTSPTYYVIAQYTNMTSNNMYAEAIHKYMGYKSTGKGSHESGAKVVENFIGSLGLDDKCIRLDDGSGLSVHNKVTADFTCRFLMEVTKRPYFEDFMKSMALAGENGTVRNLLKGLPDNVTVRIKTGSMDGVRAFAGYVINGKGHRYSFAVICNNYNCSGTQMRAKLERVIMKIATLE